MQKTLILLGLFILAMGVLWPWLSKLPLGRLPGDIALKGQNSAFFFPITTMIVISLFLSLLIHLFKR